MLKQTLIRAIILAENGELPFSEARTIISKELSEKESEILLLFKANALTLKETKKMLGLAA